MTSHRALIIEDNALNVRVLAELLGQQGFEATTFTEPRKLLAAIDSVEAVAIVFIDLEMPNISGFQVVAALRAHPTFAAVPMVAYTVHVSQFTEAHAAGFHSFLAKPLDPARFPSQLARILSGERVWERM